MANRMRHSFSYDYELAGHDIPVHYYIVDGELEAFEIGDWPLIEICRSESQISLVAAHGRLIGNVAWDCYEMILQSLGYPINVRVSIERDREAECARRGVRRLLAAH